MPKYSFDDFELDSTTFELRRDARVLKLEKIPLELLILLIERHESVVSREEITRRLWGEGVYVDAEHGINTAVRKIRTALGDNPDAPRYVKTVQGKGYRFIGEVRSARRPVAAPTEPPIVSQPPGKNRLWQALAVLLLLFVGSGWGIRWYLRTRGEAQHVRSIAVLPLLNLSGESTQEYLADGMTDEIITSLARDTSLRVVSRTSVMRFKRSTESLRDIANELGVDSVLEGSVKRVGEQTHVNLQLIRTHDDSHLWAETYDRSQDGLSGLPFAVAQAVARSTNNKMTALERSRSVSPEAHDEYLKGRFLWFGSDSGKAEPHFRKAIELQPDFSEAWSGLADTYTVSAVAGAKPTREVLTAANEAAHKAVSLNEASADAHKALAAVHFFLEWDWQAAEEESRRALELDPRDSEIHHLRSYILFTLGRKQESLSEQKKATEFDPFARPWALGRSYLQQREYEAAIAELKMRMEGSPREALIMHEFLAKAYWLKNDSDSYARELEAIYGEKSVAEIRAAFASGGERAVSRWRAHKEMTDSGFYTSPLKLANLAALVRDKEATIRNLQAGYEEHSAEMVFLQGEPQYDFVHDDPRYRDIVKKMKLPPEE